MKEKEADSKFKIFQT